MAAAVTIRRVTKTIAAVVIDDLTRSLNVLSPEVLAELAEAFKAVAADAQLEGLIIASTKPSGFLAGADIGSFSARLAEPGVDAVCLCRQGQALFGQLAKLPLVTVAAVHGPCLGGGMELAIWCDRRIAADLPHTQLGFPEVKLGLCPGWGGTARTPRMIGLANAVELITTGEPVSATAAYRLGLVEDVVPRTTPPEKLADELLAAAVRMIVAERASGQYLRDREHWSQPISQSETELMFLGATAGAVIQQKTGGHYPAPAAALELMLEAAGADLPTACELEAERFATLFGTPVNRALLNVFNLQQRAKQPLAATPRLTAKNGGAHSSQQPTVATIGAGTMGQGIAAANVRRGHRTLIADTRPEALTAAIPAILREAAYDKEAKRPTLEKTTEAAALLTPVDTDAQLATADLVIEAIVEDLAAKHAIYERLEAVVSPQTILCSNTSTLPITQLAAKLKHADRFCGLHFFNPVRKMQLVEVIAGEQTSDETLATVTGYARSLGKTPVVVRDSPGFLVNRLLMPYMNEALVLLTEGVPIKAIENAAKAFGMPMGPLTLHDVVGLDICQHAGRVLHAAYADRVVETPVLGTLIAAGRLGQKNGRGFFDYSPSKGDGPPKGKPSADVETLLAPYRKPAAARTDVTDRLLLPMLLEAIRAVEEGVVADPRDVDLALILGIGFPPFRGGLFYWADAVGAEELFRKVESFASLGARYQSPTSLKKAATERRRLTDVLLTAHSPQPTS